MVFSGSRSVSVVPVVPTASGRFSVVLYGCHGLSVVFLGSGRFSVFLVDSQWVLPVCSRNVSCRISMVLSGSRSVSVVLCCSHWFS